MNSKRNGKLLLALLLLLFFGLVQAELLVSIDPREKVEALYPYEIAFYDIVYFNAGNAIEESIQFNVSTSKALVLVVDGKEETSFKFEVEKLEPKEQGLRTIKVKALEAVSEKNFITVDYGKIIFTHSVSTFVRIEENPIAIQARIEKTALNLGEENTIYLDIENRSDQTIRDLSAQLIVPEKIEIRSQPELVSVLSPGQSIINSQFVFQPDKTLIGKQNIVLRIGYEYQEVQHIIEKSFEVDIGQREQLLYIIVGVIAGLIIISYLLQKRGAPKIELTEELMEEKKREKPELLAPLKKEKPETAEERAKKIAEEKKEKTEKEKPKKKRTKIKEE